jgi:hypothetical protein
VVMPLRRRSRRMSSRPAWTSLSLTRRRSQARGTRRPECAPSPRQLQDRIL